MIFSSRNSQNKLKREEAFSRLNLAKINEEWRTILRTCKCQELRDEIKEVEKYFGDALVRKNQMVHRLLVDLDESEELYATMSHAHIRNIDMLISIMILIYCREICVLCFIVWTFIFRIAQRSHKFLAPGLFERKGDADE